MKKIFSEHKKLFISVIAILFIFLTIAAITMKNKDTGGSCLVTVDVTGFDSVTTAWQSVNLSAIDNVIKPAVETDSAYLTAANSGSAIYYITWYHGSGIDTIGLVLFQAQLPSGKWVTCDTLKTNDTTGYQGIVKLRIRSPYYRVVFNPADIAKSGYLIHIIVWFYNPYFKQAFVGKLSNIQ